MNSELFNFLTTQGVFALLFGYLFIYVLKQNQIREENYQTIVKQLSNTLPEIKEDLEEIKNSYLNNSCFFILNTFSLSFLTPYF